MGLTVIMTFDLALSWPGSRVTAEWLGFVEAVSDFDALVLTGLGDVLESAFGEVFVGDPILAINFAAGTCLLTGDLDLGGFDAVFEEDEVDEVEEEDEVAGVEEEEDVAVSSFCTLGGVLPCDDDELGRFAVAAPAAGLGLVWGFIMLIVPNTEFEGGA